MDAEAEGAWEALEEARWLAVSESPVQGGEDLSEASSAESVKEKLARVKDALRKGVLTQPREPMELPLCTVESEAPSAESLQEKMEKVKDALRMGVLTLPMGLQLCTADMEVDDWEPIEITVDSGAARSVADGDASRRSHARSLQGPGLASGSSDRGLATNSPTADRRR